MNSEQPPGDLLARLDRLERQHRQLGREAWLWRAGTLLSLLTLAAVLVVGRSFGTERFPRDAHFPTVAAERFVLRDQAGVTRAELMMTGTDDGTDYGPALHFYTPTGGLGTGLFAGPLANGLTVFDGGGRSRCVFGVSNGMPGIELRDAAGTARLRLSLPNDRPEFEVRSSDNRPQVGISTTAGGGYAVFSDGKGRARVSVGLDAEGLPILIIMDENGRPLTVRP